MSDRVPAIAAWWDRLSASERQAARVLAHTDHDLPAALFHQLVEADVLVVTHSLRRDVELGARTFPMPADIRSFVLEATARYDGSSTH